MTVSTDKTIRIWEGAQTEAILKGHGAAITSSKMFNDCFLATGSFD